MKLTESKLRKIIKEEYHKILVKEGNEVELAKALKQIEKDPGVLKTPESKQLLINLANNHPTEILMLALNSGKSADELSKAADKVRKSEPAEGDKKAKPKKETMDEVDEMDEIFKPDEDVGATASGLLVGGAALSAAVTYGSATLAATGGGIILLGVLVDLVKNRLGKKEQ